MAGVGWGRGRRRVRGGALVLALLLTVVLLLLGSSFLVFLQRDYRLSGLQERSQQAWYLALAGLECYRAAGPRVATPLRRRVPASDPSRYFEVTVRPDGAVLSRGVVEGTLSALPGAVPTIERRALALPGALEEAYEVAP